MLLVKQRVVIFFKNKEKKRRAVLLFCCSEKKGCLFQEPLFFCLFQEPLAVFFERFFKEEEERFLKQAANSTIYFMSGSSASGSSASGSSASGSSASGSSETNHAACFKKRIQRTEDKRRKKSKNVLDIRYPDFHT